MRYTLRPLSQPGRTPTGKRRPSPFTASWADTLELLDTEVNALAGRDVVIEVDVTADLIRLDGNLRAHAAPATPAVAVAFDSKRHGPLIWRCDAYLARGYGKGPREGWRHNVRAIAMTLQALRAVDRYGAASSGEQYTGWAQLPPGPSGAIVPEPPMTRAAAAEALVLAAHPDLSGDSIVGHTRGLLDGLLDLGVTIRRAQRNTHPDTGGSAQAFDLVQRAIAVLRGAS